MEDLVTLKVAQLAKELDFDWACNTVYIRHGKTDILQYSLAYYEGDGTGNTSNIDDSDFGSNHPNGFVCTCPTQALLQKWLRDKHSIDVVALPWRDHADDINDPTTYTPFIFKHAAYPPCADHQIALDKALLEGLKIIKANETNT